MADRPTVLGVATYPDEESAAMDFRAVWRIHHYGVIDHVAAAVLVKGIDGRLRLDRHGTTASHLACGDALVGGALAVLAAPLAIAPLSDVATQRGSWAGVDGLIGHFWHNVPKRQLLQMTDLLESGQAAVVIVAIDHSGSDIEALLQNATATIVTETDGGDIEQAYQEALERDQQSS